MAILNKERLAFRVSQVLLRGLPMHIQEIILHAFWEALRLLQMIIFQLILLQMFCNLKHMLKRMLLELLQVLYILVILHMMPIKP